MQLGFWDKTTKQNKSEKKNGQEAISNIMFLKGLTPAFNGSSVFLFFFNEVKFVLLNEVCANRTMFLKSLLSSAGSEKNQLLTTTSDL